MTNADPTIEPPLQAQELYWQASAWRDVINRLQHKSLPHAMLLSGPAGLGKAIFAESLTHLLLCEQLDQRLVTLSEPGFPTPCGVCHSCHMFAAGSHPDVMRVAPETKDKSINVDKVRDIAGYLGLKSHASGYQIVLVNHAENMNHYAANSLLKTLEEPSANSLLFLISHKPSLLLPTVRSRCQSVNFVVPDNESLLIWLQKRLPWDAEKLQSLLFLSNNAPLQALDYGVHGGLDTAMQVLIDFRQLASNQQEPVSIAKNWLALDISTLYQWLISWAVAMIRLKSCGHSPDNSPVAMQLKNLADRVHLNALFAYFDKLMACYKLLNSQVNSQLLLEDLLIYWSRISQRL